MKLLLVYPPFCTPTVPPYSITYLKSFLKANTKIEITCLDLNAKFHKEKFGDLYKRLGKAKEKLNSYSELLEEYYSRAKKVYRENNIKISKNAKPELFKEQIELILKEKPDVVGFSLVYNSQRMYASALIKFLSKKRIKCVIGGPAVENNVLSKKAVELKDEIELLRFLTKKKEYKDHYVLDFSDYDFDDYLSKEAIFPLRSSYGCFYKACAFCTHHCNAPYKEIPVSTIKKSIVKNKMQNIFFIDDLVSAKRLLEISNKTTKMGIKWWCQTRPTKDLLGTFKKLKRAGVVSMSFGVESGNQTILNAMRKGTKIEDIKRVLAESHKAGIRNIVFIIFGFPGETKESFQDTVSFLEENGKNIDIISASVFGLQEGSYVYKNPKNFGICEIKEIDNYLGKIIKYKIKNGLTEREASTLKEAIMPELKKINKLPKIFCLLKEQSILI